jgi:hypothetical protein
MDFPRALSCHWWNATGLCPPPGWDNLWIPLCAFGGVGLTLALVLWLLWRFFLR